MLRVKALPIAAEERMDALVVNPSTTFSPSRRYLMIVPTPAKLIPTIIAFIIHTGSVESRRTLGVKGRNHVISQDHRNRSCAANQRVSAQTGGFCCKFAFESYQRAKQGSSDDSAWQLKFSIVSIKYTLLSKVCHPTLLIVAVIVLEARRAMRATPRVMPGRLLRLPVRLQCFLHPYLQNKSPALL